MKQYRNQGYRKIKEIGNILSNHVKSNKRDYLILSIIFILGIMIGVIMINNSTDTSKMELEGYIKSFIENVGNKRFEVDKGKLIKSTIISNLKLVAAIWLAGTTIIGIPCIYLIIIYKGISIGYTISAIMYVLGNWQGFSISFVLVFLNNLIMIPIILMLNVSSLKVYRTLIRKDKFTSIKQEMIRHTLLCMILSIPIIITGVISSYISSEVIGYISRTLIK